MMPSSRVRLWTTGSPGLKSGMGYFKGNEGKIFREIEEAIF